MTNKKIIIAGGTGFIGRYLTGYFGRENDIVILSRGANERGNAFSRFSLPADVAARVRIVSWNGRDRGDWCEYLESADLVLNLAGRSVNCRYNEKNRRDILESRVNATVALGAAIKKAKVPPRLWINAASATIYRHAVDRPQDEYTGEYENDFSVRVCKSWEQAFMEQSTPLTRKIVLRMAITLGPGSVLVPFLRLCAAGLGGSMGGGRQMFSWVHIEDLARIIEFFDEHQELNGVFNASSPNPVTNNLFMQTLRSRTGTRIALPAPRWLLASGAFIIGTETELLLKSRWVLPTRLLENGFSFKHPFLGEALADILAKMPGSKNRRVTV